MNDHGQLQLTSRPDVRSKPIALPFHVKHSPTAFAFFHLVIVKACFANGHHPVEAAFFHKVLHARLVNIFVVGVHTHRTPQVCVLERQAMHIVKLLHGGADAKCPTHLSLSHLSQDIGKVSLKFGVRQMAVRIGVHVSCGCS